MRPNHPTTGEHMTAVLLQAPCRGWKHILPVPLRVCPKRNLLVALPALCVIGVVASAAFAAVPAPAKVDALALSRHIDQAINQRLEAEQIKPSPLAADAE